MRAETAPSQRLSAAFTPGRATLMPYLVVGYPDAATFVSIARECAAAGAGVLELGIPFSDPIMDGPIIQRASTSVLDRGQTTADALALVAEAVAAAGIPAVVMTYYNLIFRHGLAAFARDVADAGACGVIVPDLVVEEADEWRAACESASIAPVFIGAITSGSARLKALASASEGFVYVASTLGVTGLRAALSSGAKGLVSDLRAATTKPLAVGIGVSNAEHAREVASYADGVIVGTAMVDAIDRGGVDAVRALVQELSAALG